MYTKFHLNIPGANELMCTFEFTQENGNLAILFENYMLVIWK